MARVCGRGGIELAVRHPDDFHVGAGGPEGGPVGERLGAPDLDGGDRRRRGRGGQPGRAKPEREREKNAPHRDG